MVSGVPLAADNQLVQAILDEDVAAVERLLLRAGAEPNAYADRCSRERPEAASAFPLLVVAACVGNANIARLLLSAGAQVDAHWREAKPRGHQVGGFTWLPLGDALSAAAERGHVDVVEALLQHKARWTELALKAAAQARQREVVRFMLAFGVHPQREAFFAAIATGDVAMVACFLEHGAPLDERLYHDRGHSPLAHAMSYGHVDVARLLLAKGAVLPPRKELRVTQYTRKKVDAVIAALDLKLPAPPGPKRKKAKPHAGARKRV